jgi:hypothetical protein
MALSGVFGSSAGLHPALVGVVTNRSFGWHAVKGWCPGGLSSRHGDLRLRGRRPITRERSGCVSDNSILIQSGLLVGALIVVRVLIGVGEAQKRKNPPSAAQVQAIQARSERQMRGVNWYGAMAGISLLLVLVFIVLAFAS